MDGKVKIWEDRLNNDQFEASELSLGNGGAHEDWVRDVAWCNNVGTNNEMIASCDEDKKLKIWTKEGNSPHWNCYEHVF